MNERKLTKSELAKREDIIMKMKDNKRALVQKYGKDAEAVMYGRATNLAKTKAEAMDQDKLREMIKDALQNPKKADLNKDGKLSDYEEKRGAAIEKSMVDEIDLDLKGGTQSNTDDAEAGILGAEDVLGLEEGSSSEEKRIAMSAIKRLAKYRGVSDSEARQDLIRAAKEVGDLKENFNQVDSQFEDLSQVVKNIAHVGEMSIEDAAMGAIDHIGEEFNVDLDFGRMNEDLDLGHEDNEPGMLKSDLYRIGKYAMDLYQMMDEFEAGSEEVDFPHWWQAKIIRAKDSLVGAKHYLDFEVKEPSIDAVVDTIDDIAPEMEIDVVDDIEEVDNFNPKKTDDPQLDSFRSKGQLEGLPKGYWDKKMDAEDEIDESYNTLVNKIKKSGKSEKAAKAIAGAVASYKAKGGGKGPTAKQKG